MKWNEIIIRTTEEACDAISEMLTSIGAGGVAIEDPNDIRREIEKPNTLDYADPEFLNSLGEDVVIKAYFPGENNIEGLIELIKKKINLISAFLNTGAGYTGYSEVDELDWANAWKKHYKPLHVTNNIVIKPSWEIYDKKDKEIVVELDPGMAFGTGTHETTRMCIQLIEKYMKKGDTVIDLGCGTGILSIVAAKLGARHVTSVDIDEVAVRVTRENCAINNVSEYIDCFAGVLDDIRRDKADLVVANIIANVIIDISKTIPYYVKTNGYFITSGIIKERKQEVIDAYESYDFICEETIEDGEWVAMSFRCQGSL